MRQKHTWETVFRVSEDIVTSVMDHSDGKEAKRRALSQQEQLQQQAAASASAGQQAQWAPAGQGYGIAQQPQQYAGQQAPYAPTQPSISTAGVPAAASYPATSAAAQAAAAPYVQARQLAQQQQQPLYPIHQQRYAGYAQQQQQQQQPQYPVQQPGMYFDQQTGAPQRVGVAPQPGMSYQAQQQLPQQVPPQFPMPVPTQPYIQPKVGRLPADRPVMKLSVSLIDTYKHINTVYYEERDARRAARSKEKKGSGSNNNGWDDDNYDYIFTSGELFYGRYKIKERIGKGSFGQVVRAEDIETNREVAIKIIKSKKPFLLQAKTEIELLTHLWEHDPEDQHNVGTYRYIVIFLWLGYTCPVATVSNPRLFLSLFIYAVRLLTHFVYRNHQCLVFEMLSLNLYELLKNTQFGGVSLNLIRKFAKQVLKALSFLARDDVDIIHCDLKPENILLRHPKKSGVKVIDFGSSCRSNQRMYSYIQSRFYRSPEVMLGLPYSVAIDMWSLGCILAEMHTGEPLFSGSDQFDQMQKIVKLLGVIPDDMLSKSSDQIKLQFFEKGKTSTGQDEWRVRQTKASTTSSKSESTSPSPSEPPKNVVVPSSNPVASLMEVVSSGNRQKKKYPPSEEYNSQQNYEMFVDLVYKMLSYEPLERITPHEALNHPFILSGDTAASAAATADESATAKAATG